MSTEPNGPNKPKQPQDDFDALGKAIEQEVRAAVTTLSGALQTAAVSVAETVRQNMDTVQPLQETVNAVRRKAKKVSEKAKRSPEKCSKKANEASGTAGAFALVGGIMTAVTIASMTESNFVEDWPGSLVLAVIAAWFVYGSISALLKSKRLRRLALYMNLMGDRTYCTVEQLAQATGKSQHYVRKDLRKMLESGLLEGAYLSPNVTRLFAGDMAYRLYLSQTQAAEQAAAERAAQKKQVEAAPAAEQGAQNAAKPEGVLAECDAFAAQLQKRAELIDDAAVTEQVDLLAQHTRRIRTWLATHPDKENRVRRFTGYYLPTVIKLLDTYTELDPHAVRGSVAARSQKDITDILSTINAAFQTLENGLVQDTALDVSAEISALQTVMAQEGLTQNDAFGSSRNELS